MTKVIIDMNNPVFQKDLFALDKNDQLALIRVLKKINQLTWSELYKDQGLKWELIISKTSYNKERVYSFRFSGKYRALALREESFLRLLTLHVDHDSAYK